MKFCVMLLSFLLIFITAGPLSAAEQKKDATPRGLYVSLTPSAVYPFSVETSSPTLTPGETKSEWGVGIGTAAGYRYGDLRIEGEIAYSRNDGKEIHFIGGGGPISGYYDMWQTTVNFYYDIPTGYRLRPYVGAGLGVARFEAQDITLSGCPPTVGRSTLFTYRLMAGMSWAVTDAWRLLCGYRFTAVNGPDFETGGVPLYGEPLQIHSVCAGVQYYF